MLSCFGEIRLELERLTDQKKMKMYNTQSDQTLIKVAIIAVMMMMRMMMMMMMT